MRRLLLAGLVSGFTAPATAQATVPVDTPVLARAVEKGELLSEADFASEPRPPAAGRGALDAAAAAGKAAARRLLAGTPVRAGDLVRAPLVQRGETVTIALRSGPLLITTAGRALSAGAMGEAVRVMSLSTNRTLHAVVEEAGRVRVVAPEAGPSSGGVR